jgi:hypothetical protein
MVSAAGLPRANNIRGLRLQTVLTARLNHKGFFRPVTNRQGEGALLA